MKGKAMRIKLTANRQTGQMGSGPHPLAKCICGRKGRGPAPRRSAASIGAATQLSLVRLRRSAAIIGAAQAQRSYYWCCYAAIIGAATQLSLVLLRSYYWCCYAAIIGAATQLLLCATILILSSCARSRSSSSVFPMIIAASIIGAATRRISGAAARKGKGAA